jgi:hypothetical protein
MQHVRNSLILLFCLMVLCCAVEARTEISLEASLNHLSFPVDQGALLTITVNGASRISTLELPEIAGITFQNRGQSSRINIINGSMTSSLSNSYMVQAQKPGIYTIPPIKVNAGGETASTRPMSFEVTGTAKGSTTNSGGAERSPEEVAYIRIPEFADHYPGEIVPIRINAYFNQKYRSDINSLPTLRGDGVVMPQLREKPTQTQEIINGVPYHVLSWDTTLAGIKAGKHPLTFSMEASILIPQKRRQVTPFGGDLFDDSVFNDPFFDSVFSGAQRKAIDIFSPESVFNVIPLPTTDQPKDFNGAIGDFTLKVVANRRDLEVGEPLKLSVEISGSGNFDRVEAPSFPDSPDWKTYTPTGAFTSQGNSYTGVKVFDQAIVAKNETVHEIPGLSFSYFDPVNKEYITKTSAPISIKLAKSATAPASPPPPLQRAAVPPPSQSAPVKTSRGFEQMAPLNVQMGGFQQEITPLFMRSWFLALIALCILIIVALFLLQLHRKNLQKHPEKELQRRKNHLLTGDLNHVEQAYNSGNSLQFLASSRTAIQNQLGISWNMAPSAISLASLTSRLGPESPLVEIFAAADAAAYGGAILSREKMQDYLQTMEKALEELP